MFFPSTLPPSPIFRFSSLVAMFALQLLDSLDLQNKLPRCLKAHVRRNQFGPMELLLAFPLSPLQYLH